MIPSAEHEPDCVVIAPDVLARSFVDARCRKVLERWRDGVLRPVVTRDLLTLYLQVLRGLGLQDSQVHRWMCWFTSEEKCVVLLEAGLGVKGLPEIFRDAARLGEARAIVRAKVSGSMRDSQTG